MPYPVPIPVPITVPTVPVGVPLKVPLPPGTVKGAEERGATLTGAELAVTVTV